MKLLDEAGLIEADDYGDLNGLELKPRSLAWEGHEFLANARNDTAWRQTVIKVGNKVGTVSMNIFAEVLEGQCCPCFNSYASRYALSLRPPPHRQPRRFKRPQHRLGDRRALLPR